MSFPFELGQIFAGKYLIERVLGEGGMGVVVVAKHVHLEQLVAIKFLHPGSASREDVVERFTREAKASAKIRGQHVAKVLDVGREETSGSPYMVMEFLEGEDLSQRLARVGALSASESVGYLIEACEAIAEAHVANIVHRDLKPANLYLAKQPGGREIIKVLDFGISKDLSVGSSAGLTGTTSIMGTASYMSPEQLQSSKTVDLRTDIWALGVILYELLTNEVPFDAESLPEVIAHILQNHPPDVRTYSPDVPAELVAVIAKCMHSDREERYQNAGELAVALLPFVEPDLYMDRELLARRIGQICGENTSLISFGSTKGRSSSSASAPALSEVQPHNERPSWKGGGLTNDGGISSDASPQKKYTKRPVVWGVAAAGSISILAGGWLIYRSVLVPDVGSKLPTTNGAGSTASSGQATVLLPPEVSSLTLEVPVLPSTSASVKVGELPQTPATKATAAVPSNLRAKKVERPKAPSSVGPSASSAAAKNDDDKSKNKPDPNKGNTDLGSIGPKD